MDKLTEVGEHCLATGHSVSMSVKVLGREQEWHRQYNRISFMLRWARGKTRLDHARDVDTWKEAHMYLMAEFLREKRLRWYGHVKRLDKDDATSKILQMTVDGKRNRGRPKPK